ncbi:MAG TPA: ABC transporter substrate-binding protein [Terriglobia bacterium]|nr:ABC transporter substrate-binding protein [Terriglobia bacterium]
MFPTLRRIFLGVTLIVLASAVLLLSDLNRRTHGQRGIPRIGVLQHASTLLLDDGVRGMVDSLAQNGFVDGKTAIIERYNAEGDIALANSIAKEMVNAHFDLLLTASTLSLQTVANANRSGKTVQVFGLVADPAVAGVGISHDEPLDHPRNLVGIGSFIPVAEAFRTAREMFPSLKTVGVAWNPAEANSRAFTEDARKACQAAGIELLEANVENSNGVLEAEESLVARGAQALWIGGDVTVNVAVDSVISVARKARIPVFTITPGKPDRGTLFDAGADFYQIGRQTGTLAAQILRGANPAQIPITNAVPKLLVVNTLAVQGLKDPWRVPDDVLRRADVVVDQTGVHIRRTP